MPFDATTTTLDPPRRMGDTLSLSWSSTAPGSTYQVYVDRRLAWHGTAQACRLPWPQSHTWIVVGTVDGPDAATDFSSTLTSPLSNRAVLNWMGGTYQTPKIDRFAVYGPATAGGPIDYTKSLATIPAYDGGIITDGYGMGGYGQGGFGQSASSYSWTSDPLPIGPWSFAVEAVDQSGASSPAASATVAITGPPRPPAADPNGVRLKYAYTQATGIAVLSWLPSPQL